MKYRSMLVLAAVLFPFATAVAGAKFVTSDGSKIQDVLKAMKESGKTVKINDVQGKIVGLSDTLVEIDQNPARYEIAVIPLAEIKSATIQTGK